MLNQQEIDTLNQLERLAMKWEFQARQLKGFVYQCREQQTTEGIGEMVAFSFNAQQYSPRYGGSNEQLPPGKYKGVIVDATPQNTTDQAGHVKGGYLALTLTPIEGALAGQKHIDRLNLHNVNAKTVEIANEQMSAYCHVLNVLNPTDTMQLCNIPFLFEIGWQKGNEPSEQRPTGGYTEVKAIYDINGNIPGKAGAGPAVAAAPVAAPPAVAPAAAPVAAPAGWGAQPPAAEAAPPAQPPVAAPPAAWGAQPPAQPAPTATPPAAAPGGAPWGPQA